MPPGGYCDSDEWDVSNENGSDEVINNYSPAFGPYSTSALPAPFTAPGTYSVCGFLYVNNGHQLIYTTGTIAVSQRPPAPCVVPSYAGLTQREMIHRLLGAHCTGGRIIPVRSRLRSGQVVKLGARPGTRLAHGTEVSIYISRGEQRRR